MKRFVNDDVVKFNRGNIETITNTRDTLGTNRTNFTLNTYTRNKLAGINYGIKLCETYLGGQVDREYLYEKSVSGNLTPGIITCKNLPWGPTSPGGPWGPTNPGAPVNP